MMIKHFGLDPDKDVKFIPGGSGEGRYIRMQQGLLDATVATVPNDYLGRKMGFPIIVRSEDLFTYPFSGLTAHVKKIKEKPDEVKRSFARASKPIVTCDRIATERSRY
jgi:ABC-type nitrate/sulfonate/bicarbonate transport system substrate-binding protein